MSGPLGKPTVIVVPTVVTDRLILRCWRAGDIDPYAAMNADEETMRHLNGAFDRDATERLISHLIGMWVLLGHGMWAVEDKGTGEFLGRAGLYFGPGWPGVEVAVSIRRDRWGEGLGMEACRAAIAWGFATLAVGEIVTFTNRDNAGMNAIARKLGMTFQGEASAIGPWRDNNVYAITRQTWEARTSG
ncbi:GNAT family N-acetyltransferase [Frankia sp. CiP3]|uniref:GNAT family N-acetyltransferase n=1 Tax=Frankia sp. CiP3 TaxID=2880971 RepID=UPI001EF41516|nr:GNAT family protein [Frankia sp. CiP3]